MAVDEDASSAGCRCAFWYRHQHDCESCVPVFYREFIDLLSVAQSREEAYPVLFQIIMAMLTVSLIDRVFQRASGFFDAAFQCRVMADLCTESFRVLLRHSHGFFANNFTGALVQKVNRLSRSFERFWDAIQYGFFPLSIRIIGTIILLWTVNSSVAIAMLVWTILFIIFNVLFSLYKIRFDTIRANLDSKSPARSLTRSPITRTSAFCGDRTGREAVFRCCRIAQKKSGSELESREHQYVRAKRPGSDSGIFSVVYRAQRVEGGNVERGNICIDSILLD